MDIIAGNQHKGLPMKQFKGLGGWIRSAICWTYNTRLLFVKTFGTADAKFRFLDQFMYPPLFINICGYFRDLPVGHYTGRFLRHARGSVHRCFVCPLIGFYNGYSKTGIFEGSSYRLDGFILIRLMTVSCLTCSRSIGMGCALTRMCLKNW